MTRANLLALADCVACLALFADEGIAMTPDSDVSDPQNVLIRLSLALGFDGDWTDCAAALRARAEEASDGE